MSIHLGSPGLKLPPDTVTSTLIVYGGKGMGKTTFGSVLCEELYTNKQRFSVIDPMGVWWGLRHSADGKGAGIEVLILGGRHGDMPIEPTGGAVIADLVADESISVIIDISRKPDGKMWARGERVKFVADYCTRLYERQGERRRPLMQIIDEAGRYVPEVIRKEEADVARCVGAVASLVEEARNVGVGVTLITQRSARMNKAVSELADAMFAFRTLGPRSVESILDWFGEHVPKDRWKELTEQLRSLPRGTALVVSPGWLEFEGRSAIRMRHTFDSSATPKAGKEQHASGPGAKPDLARYRERMAETIQRAEQDDPASLRRKIAELTKELAKRVPTPAAGNTSIDAQAIAKARAEGAQGAKLGIRRALSQYERAMGARIEGIRSAITALTKRTEELPAFRALEETAGLPFPAPQASHAPLPLVPRPVTRMPPEGPGAQTSDGSLSPAERRLLIALAQYPRGLTKERLAILSNHTLNGTFYNRLGALRTRGAISGAKVEPITIRDEGLRILGSFEELPVGENLRNYWLRKVPTGEAKILAALIDVYPGELSQDMLAEASGHTLNGTFYNRLGALRTKGLVTPAKTTPRAAHELFDEHERAAGA